MSAFLDDVDSRPGSTTSLLRTVIGLYLRDAGGWLPASAFLRLMEALDVPAAVTRTALSRLKKKAVLEQQPRDGVAGYALTSGAATMLARGDSRIFAPQHMADGDPWCLVSFSIPEAEREKRHQLRRRLHWTGCGTVAAGLWIAPAFRRGEIEDVLAGLGLREQATLFITDTPVPGGGHHSAGLRDAAAQWWDLETVAALHRDFIREWAAGEDPSVGGGPPPPAAAFASYVRCIDSWRIIPYLDPGLPPVFLPADWPGKDGIAVFEGVRAVHAGPSADFVRTVAGGGRQQTGMSQGTGSTLEAWPPPTAGGPVTGGPGGFHDP
ncbi:PaaX family transcriptional regulator [Arthrobacter silvisoli]|uniref:PaaX family transcriptional regulator n=1 Tax=Arthrobacter silvisoli TaxID=2291022 RepID=UPI000E20CF3D|nr:PaaX family transcriptional regulator C-terminal domain-containing protein [Arthrobacter silvisoli]